MRKIAFILMLFPVFSIAQELQNFNVAGNSLSWEKVYESDLSAVEISAILEKDAVLNSLCKSFTGQAAPQKINCEETQAMFMDGSFQYFASIEFKEGRYRVKVSNIEIIPATTMELWGVKSSENPEPYSGIILKKDGRWRTNTLAQNSRSCLDHYLSEKFTFAEVKNEW